MRVLSLFVAALLLAACSQPTTPPSDPNPAATEPAPSTTARATSELEDLQRQLREKDDIIASLQTRVELLELAAETPTGGGDGPALVADLERRLSERERERAHWEAETRKYRAALERAVAELNRVSASAQIQVPSPSPAPSRSASPGRISQYSPPRVTAVTPDSVTIQGKLWNSGDVSKRVTLEVVLLFDGAEVERTTQQETVPQRGAVEYTTTFHPRRRGSGRWSARVTVL